MQNVGKGLKQMNMSVGAMSAAFRGIGMAITAFTTMAMAALDSMINTVLQLEKPLKKLEAVAADSGKSQVFWFDLASKIAQETGAEIIKVADAMYWAASAGYHEAEAVETLTNKATMMARIHGVDATEAIAILSRTMKTFGVEVENVTDISTILNAAVGRSLLTFSALGDTLKYAGPLARAVGWDFEGLMAGIMAMAEGGIAGSKAGTSLRAVITRLAAPAARARKLMDELGLEFFELKEGGEEVKAAMNDARIEFERLSDEVEEAEASIESLRATMSRQALEERKLRYEISAIRLRAAAEDRDISDEEMKIIDRLNLAIEGMAYEREGLGIVEEEASMARDKLAESAEEQAEIEEELAEELVGLRGEMKELPEIMDEVADAMQDMSSQQRLSTSEILVGKRGLAGFILMLMNAHPELFTYTDLMMNAELGMEEFNLTTKEGVMTLSELRDMLAQEKAALDESFEAKAEDITLTSTQTVANRIANEVLMEQYDAFLSNTDAMETAIEAMGTVKKVINKLVLMFADLVGILGGTGTAVLLMLGPILMFGGPVIALVIKGIAVLIGAIAAHIGANIGLAASYWGLVASAIAFLAANPFTWALVAGVIAVIAGVIFAINNFAGEMGRSMEDIARNAEDMTDRIERSIVTESLPSIFKEGVSGAISHLDRLREAMKETSRETANQLNIGVGAGEGGAAIGGGVAITINVTTGPVTGIGDVEDIGRIIGEKVVEGVRRAIP